MEAFLGGLPQMIEEMFGSTWAYLFVLLIMLGIGSWMVKLFCDNTIRPLYLIASALVNRRSEIWGMTKQNILSLLWTFTGSVFILGAVALLAWFLYFRPQWTEVNNASREVKQMIIDVEEMIIDVEETKRQYEQVIRESEVLLEDTRSVYGEAQILMDRVQEITNDPITSMEDLPK